MAEKVSDLRDLLKQKQRLKARAINSEEERSVNEPEKQCGSKDVGFWDNHKVVVIETGDTPTITTSPSNSSEEKGVHQTSVQPRSSKNKRKPNDLTHKQSTQEPPGSCEQSNSKLACYKGTQERVVRFVPSPKKSKPPP